MRQRAEKGLWNGGHTPFGFVRDFERKAIIPDAEQVQIVESIFRVYIDTSSEFKVRDWLKAHQIASPTGRPVWSVSTIRDILMNRLYIAQIEVNRRNKNNDDVPEIESYRIVKAPFEPLISGKLFDTAQLIRSQKTGMAPKRTGSPRSFSQSQCGHVYSLQGLMTCGCCGHAMTPWYVMHRAGKHRRKDSYINYYICAKQMKAWKQTDHKNLILARKSEAWMIDQIRELAESPAIVERVLYKAIDNTSNRLQPQKDALALTQAALRTNQERIEQMYTTMESNKITDSLLVMLNERATALQEERERLKKEQRELSRDLSQSSVAFEPDIFSEQMVTFTEQIAEATPEEIQRLLRLMVRRVEWMPNGDHKVEFYCLPSSMPENLIVKKTSPSKELGLVATKNSIGCPWDSYVEPYCLIVPVIKDTLMQLRESLFQSAIA